VERVAYGWIGGGAAGGAPSLVVTAAYSALGAVRRLQVRVGAATVLLHCAPPLPADPEPGGGAATPPSPPPLHSPGADGAGWVRDGVVAELDVGEFLADRLDLAGREDEGTGESWGGTLPAGRYGALRLADPADAGPLAAAAGCPVELVRALADPVALARVEVVRRDGADRATGPTVVGQTELAWVDGGPAGLWTVRPDGPDDVRVDRGTPAGVAAELAAMVRGAEGC
jgi:hypothetical protein